MTKGRTDCMNCEGTGIVEVLTDARPRSMAISTNRDLVLIVQADARFHRRPCVACGGTGKGDRLP